MENVQVREYLDWKATYTRRASINYKPWLEKFMSCTEKSLENTVVGDIIKYRNWLEDKNYQPKSIELAMVIVKNYFYFWKLQGKKCLSPELIRVQRTVANSYQPITFEEYTSILSFIHPTDFWELQKLVIIRLLFETGVRVSELCDLNISDFNPEKSCTTIRTKKTAIMRTIFWSVETNIFIKTFLAWRKEINSTPAFFVGKSKSKSSTDRMTTRTVQRLIKDLCLKAGIVKQLSPHSFRHGKAHRVLDLGGNPKDVQALLGHSSPMSSFTYLQWNDKEFALRAKMFLPE